MRRFIFWMLLFLPLHAFGEINILDEWPGYYGIGFKPLYASGRGEWDLLLNDNHPSLKLFLGGKFHPKMGFEFGTAFSDRRIKNLTLNPGETLFGLNGAGSGETSVDFKVRLKGFYFDLSYYLLANSDSNFLMSVGVASLKLAPSVRSSTMDTEIDYFLTGGGGYLGLDSKSRIIPRAALGGQLQLTRTMGVRAMLRYEHIRLAIFSGAPNSFGRPLNGGYSGEISLYWTF